ncbi:LOW QUALITY PROTEIN: putative receptor-like protein kinase At1g80870 [Dioscorea cayenensis subsp. rotundata]|uniref:LOW QUALITY PROTEIN: putative receptor-like protein kinase At1g80870 n=1 Tax=Dioscorea cayennensis subsp. rotundata TaxID=55577 RepID=A0AB40CSL2_DIOCR|nr:LOW QUALITY PROTEIN: putative receptor-like protein kinase At1g80870 [Dioscorea cayenensis subsp. rotundata]
MPSRPLSPSYPRAHKAHALLLAGAVAGATLLVVVLVLLMLLYFYFSIYRRSPTLPLPSPSPLPLRRFRHRDLRRATASFHHSRRLGRGSTATVLRAALLPAAAVKLFDPIAVSETTFLNEFHTLAAIPHSPFIVSLLGYCLSRRCRALVFEFMPNGSLQDALFHPSDALTWDHRFRIILDVAQALAFLHLECDPPVIHGDIKPSNVLLGADFSAKISDFGLARFKTEGDLGVEMFSQELWKSQELASLEADFAFAPPPKKAATGVARANDKGKEPALAPVPPATAAVVPCNEESVNLEHSNGEWGKDWWWKQDGSGELSSKEYVHEWIGSQICVGWEDEENGEQKSSPLNSQGEAFFNNCEAKHEKKLSNGGVDKKTKKVREWWKEEYFAEISKKGKHDEGFGFGLRSMRWFRNASCRGGGGAGSSCSSNGNGYVKNMEVSFRNGWRRKRSRSAGSELFSGEMFSRELSSTTSMRGTVCYIAPESGNSMEKGDVYSFGVLILVILSGRRPLHVLSSPMKLEKANLVSWCRHLAQSGNVLDLVDERLKDLYDKEQASLCINLALLCLQRSPESRPDSGDIVRILKGEMDVPVVPFEFSPSPKLNSRSRRRTPTR